MDFPGDDVPRGMVPNQKTAEQLAAERLQREINKQQMPIILEVIADYEQMLESVKDVDKLNLESKIPVESQIIAAQYLGKLAKAKIKEYRDRYKMAQDSLDAAAVEDLQ